MRRRAGGSVDAAPAGGTASPANAVRRGSDPTQQAGGMAKPARPARPRPRRSPQRKGTGGHQVRPRLARRLRSQQQVQRRLLLLAALHNVAAGAGRAGQEGGAGRWARHSGRRGAARSRHATSASNLRVQARTRRPQARHPPLHIKPCLTATDRGARSHPAAYLLSLTSLCACRLIWRARCSSSFRSPSCGAPSKLSAGVGMPLSGSSGCARAHPGGRGDVGVGG